MEDMFEDDGNGGDNGQNFQELENGGIALLSDEDDQEEEDEEEEDNDLLTNTERREKFRAKQERRKAKRTEKEATAPAPDVHQLQIFSTQRVKINGTDYMEMRLDKRAEGCRGSIIFEGFPSKGIQSMMISKFLVKGLKLPLIGEIHSNLFPALIPIINGQPSHPVRIYGDSKAVVFTSNIPISPDLATSVVSLIYGFQKEFACTHIIAAETFPEELEMLLPDDPNSLSESGLVNFIESMADMPKLEKAKEKHVGKKGKGKEALGRSAAGASDPVLPEEKEAEDAEDAEDAEEETSPSGEINKAREFFGTKKIDTEEIVAERTMGDVLYITNNKEIGLRLRNDFGYIPIKDALVGNITGLILAESWSHACPVVCFVGRHNPILTDARASVMIMKAIVRFLGPARLSIDVHPLEHEADKMERSVKKQVRKALSLIRKGGHKKTNASQMMYM